MPALVGQATVAAVDRRTVVIEAVVAMGVASREAVASGATVTVRAAASLGPEPLAQVVQLEQVVAL